MFSNNLLMAAAGGGGAGYVIEGSALFDGSSAYLSRTPASAGNRKTWTQSGWIKRGALTASGQYPFLNTNTGGNDGSVLHANDDFQWLHASYNYRETDAVLRDEGGWYHIVWNLDTTLSASTAVRSKCWINGVEQAYHYDQDGPAEDLEPQLNNNVLHGIGYNIYDGRNYYDGYLAEYIFIDGLALDHTYFGETDSTTGQWIPKDPSGLTFGTNGFWLGGGANIANGIDSSATSTTAATIAYCAQSSTDSNLTDYSGSFDGISIGTATATRYVAVTINGPRATAGARTVSTVTDSTSTTDFSLVVRQTSTNGDAHEIWISDSPITSGTTANIDIVFSSSIDACAISTWELNNIDITSPLTASELGTSLSEPINIPANAVCLAAGRAIANDRATWAGVAEAYDVDFNGENGGDTAGSSSTSANPTTVSCTFSSPTSDDTMCVAVFLPADGPLNHFTKSGTITATNDSPTNDAENDYGNYCRIDPNAIHVTSTTNGNKSATSTATDRGLGFGTLPFDSEDATGFYFEIVPKTSAGSTIGAFALGACTADLISIAATRPSDTNAASWIFHGDGGINHTAYTTNGAWDSQANGTGALNDTFQFVYKNGSCYFGINDTWYDSSDGSFGNAGSAFDSITGMLYPMLSHGSASVCTWDLLTADEDFNMTKPTGLKNIGTHTMPTPAIPDPTEHHQVELVAHDGSSTNVTCNWDMDVYDTLIITKNRDSAEAWYVSNAIDGYNKYDSWDNNAIGVTTDANVHAVSGATLTLGSTLSNDAYVVEFHKAGLVASRDTTNSDGSITGAGDSLIISANTTSGFSMLTFTGGGIADTVGHGLTQAPEFIITHSDNGGDQHAVYHVGVASDAETDYLALDTNAAAVDTDMWNDTAPTASVYSIGTSTYASRSGATFTTFLWHGVEGYSAFFSFEGVSSGEGPMVSQNMLPESFLMKPVDNTGNWRYFDTKRPGYNTDNFPLYFDGTWVEGGTVNMSLVSTGMKHHGDTGVAGTFIGCMWGGRPIQGPAPASNTNQGRAR